MNGSQQLYLLIISVGGIVFSVGCAPKSAPAIGAERVFEKGLKPEKHPQQLFNRKERKDMERMGTMPSAERRRGNTSAPAVTPVKPAPARDTSTTIRL